MGVSRHVLSLEVFLIFVNNVSAIYDILTFVHAKHKMGSRYEVSFSRRAPGCLTLLVTRFFLPYLIVMSLRAQLINAMIDGLT